LNNYGKFFHPGNLGNITQEDFRAFLAFKNNRHWANIQRQPNIYADMDRLKAALAVLLDEDLTRLGRNTAKPTDTFGKRYIAINEACHRIAGEINQPLALVDSMFSLIVHGAESRLVSSSTFGGGNGGGEITEPAAMPVDTSLGDSFVFPLEKYLEDFLVSNWDKTVLGKMLALHVEDEESPTQYPTDLGPIDILARDKGNHDWGRHRAEEGQELRCGGRPDFSIHGMGQEAQGDRWKMLGASSLPALPTTGSNMRCW
jgi:hypothetical protein